MSDQSKAAKKLRELVVEVTITDGPIISENITIDQRFRFEQEISKLKALLRRCKSPVFEAHYEELHAEILEVLGE